MSDPNNLSRCALALGREFAPDLKWQATTTGAVGEVEYGTPHETIIYLERARHGTVWQSWGLTATGPLDCWGRAQDEDCATALLALLKLRPRAGSAR